MKKIGKKNNIALFCFFSLLTLLVLAFVFLIWWLILLALIPFIIGFINAWQAKKISGEDAKISQILFILYMIMGGIFILSNFIRMLVLIPRH